MKILISLFILFSPGLFATDCSGIWANGYPDVNPRTTPVPCDEFEPVATPRTISQRFYTVSSLTHNDLVKQQMEQIAEAVNYAAFKYETYGRVPNIVVVREANPHPNAGGPEAFAFAYVQFFNLDAEACPIFVYPLSEVLNKEHLQQMIAHEVFHCVQKYNFKDQVTVAVNSSDAGWWFEGLAQLFSNFVYPRNDFEYTSRFPAPDQTLPFFDQPNAYSSENFWQSYSNTVGEGVIWNAMGSMPLSTGVAAANIASELPRISEGLHNYAKQITQKKVRDSSGMMSPYDMPLENHTLADVAHQEVRLSHYDFTVGGHSITIPKAGKWTFTFNRPDNTKISMRKPGEEDFAPVDGSFEITSECEGERTIQVVITRAMPDQSMASTRMVIDKRPNPDCNCMAHPDAPPQVDQCLIGNWTLDHGSVQQYWDRIDPTHRSRLESSTGAFNVSFGADHVGRWEAGNWALSARSEMSNGMVMRLVRTTNGVSTFNYSAGNGTACSTQTSSGMTAIQVISVAGRTGTSTHVLPFDPSSGYFTYSCDPSTFVLRMFGYSGGEQMINYVFHRL